MYGDVKKFIKWRKTQDEQPVYYAIMEDKYDIISRSHFTTDNGGCDRMLKHLLSKSMPTARQKLLNSTSPIYCLVCQKKRKHPRTTGVVVNSRGHQHVFNVCVCSFSRNLALWMPWLAMNHYELRIVKDSENPCPMDVLPNDLAILRSVIYQKNQPCETLIISTWVSRDGTGHGHGFWVMWELMDIDIAYV